MPSRSSPVICAIVTVIAPGPNLADDLANMLDCGKSIRARRHARSLDMNEYGWNLGTGAAATIAVILLHTSTVLALDEFPEDLNYASVSASAPENLETPLAARTAFGKPADWMQWVESSGYTGNGGGYAGLKRQDSDRAFIFLG